MTKTLKPVLALLALAATLALAACGDDDDDSGGGGDSEAEAAAAALEIVSTDSGIDVPATVDAGLTEISFTNDGKGDHEAQLIRIVGNHTAEEILKVTTGEGGGIPEWMEDGGGVGTTKPGQTRTATQVLTPGRYGVIDTDAKKPQSAEFEVTGEVPADAELPDAPATVTASEYTFETSGLKPGSNTILFENTGKELHHALANPVKPGTTVEQVNKYFQSDGKGPNPFKGGDDAGVGTAVIDGGISQVAELNLPKGDYAFMCFIPDRKGGPPHAVKGMVTIEQVQ